MNAPHFRPFVPFLQRPTQSRRPSSGALGGEALSRDLQETTIRVWLHALDGDGRNRSESRKLVRTVARELGLRSREARQLVEQALREPRSIAGLRAGLTTEQRARLLQSAAALARANGRGELFDRLSAPLLARWLDLSARDLAAVRSAADSTRPLRWRWRAA